MAPSKKEIELKSERLWNTEEIFRLIELVENKAVLWNLRTKAYRNRNLKDAAFEEIGLLFKTSGAEIARNLHNLRSQFNEQKRKIKTKKSGQGLDANFKTRWEYFNALTSIFDISPAESSKTISNVPSQNSNDPEAGTSNSTDTTNDAPQFVENIPSCSSRVNNNKKKRRSDNDEDLILQKALSILNQPQDEYQVFGDFVASEIRNLALDENKRKLKRTIQKSILEVSEADAQYLTATNENRMVEDTSNEPQLTEQTIDFSEY